MRKLLFFVGVLLSWHASAQDSELKLDSLGDDGNQIILISDMQTQIDVNQAMNNLYNFKFEKAEREFRYMKHKYGWHPLPYFLLGLSEWWKIMPNMNDTSHDEKFLAYMDTVVMISERLYEIPRHEVEATFFLAAAYGFEGRLYSSEERKNWRKAAVAGKNALRYMQEVRDKQYLSVELLFGDGLYNYFSVWVPENYVLLRPVMAFFPKGDKELGLKQLKEVSFNAFYTRTEAQVFLMRILNSYENDQRGAMQISEYLHQTYPDNPYFHRYYARMLYSAGRFRETLPVAQEIMDRIDRGMIGYESTSGRYAAFFLGQIYENRKEYDLAANYYQRAIDFARDIGADDSGYYHYSLLSMGDIAAKNGDKKKAKEYYRLVKDEAKRGDRVHKLAREKLNDL
ncbi:tetratricopeptide repeat protein [Fulvivirga sedimenti]|uniref:Tetratricopeptide repeat protein n=1 Tax=Fulvivirga sedimenti TaxID=2879465 RepID=A0A9X1HW23_9BACT|nr:tetratricopeptide repeat protein [Fulvivirga sedimenti]MCA6078113.1 tetratricopeptide repeat protein [Fulvivirga sedimenti]